ncbi:MAG TPA: DUF2955 domain-containing protein [Woeseiaceae bacterium]|nr:DUF2955 domain-containing protein [Woeseiaceae bacterium]
MPTETAARQVASRRALRLAAGTALAMWVSGACGWTLSYIAPVLTLVILALPLSRPKPRFFLMIVAAVVVSVYGSFIFLPLLLYFRLAGLILLALALFHTFYLTARGKPAAISTLLTIGITLTVAVGSVSVDALLVVAEGVFIGAIVGALIAWMAHVALPDPPLAAPPKKPPAPETSGAIRLALRSLAVVLPVSVWFLMSPASAGNAAVMIKVASMGQEATAEKSRRVAKSLLVSTAAGGIAAIVAWQILAIWPSLTLYTLLFAIASLWFAGKIFAGYGLAADGDTWNYALLTMIIILAPAALDSQFGSDAGASFYQRLFMLMGASLYGVVAIYVFDAFWPARQNEAPAAGRPAAGGPPVDAAG